MFKSVLHAALAGERAVDRPRLPTWHYFEDFSLGDVYKQWLNGTTTEYDIRPFWVVSRRRL